MSKVLLLFDCWLKSYLVVKFLADLKPWNLKSYETKTVTYKSWCNSYLEFYESEFILLISLVKNNIPVLRILNGKAS